MTKRFEETLRRGLLLAGSVVVALVVGEFYLRRFRPVEYLQPPRRLAEDTWRTLLHRRSRVPGLLYELVPNASKFAYGAMIRTNSHGMRDIERVVGRDTLVVRIAAIGDSFTFGFGVDGEAAYPAVLEELLNESRAPPGGRFEVLNFGVAGYGARDEAVVVKHKALVWQPDVLIVGYVLNDPETEPYLPLHRYYQDVRWWQHSHVLRLLAKTRRDWDIKKFGGGNYVAYLHAHPSTWGSVTNAFAEIANATRHRGIRVLVAIFPIVVDRWAEYPYGRIHEQVAAAARRSGFQVVDLYDVFARHPPSDLRLSRGDAHLSKFAHRLTARAIRDALVKE